MFNPKEPTLTVPALLAGRTLFCTVSGALKNEAVRCTLWDPLHPMSPATMLRQHPRFASYLDPESTSEPPFRHV